VAEIRRSAHDAVAWAIANARSGAGTSLVLVGEPGSGKSTLLDSAVRRAGDATVLRTTGVPVESGLPHGAYHALFRPLLPELDQLPEVQREAVEVALGHAAGPPPAPFLLGAATLTLLAAAAERAPVVVVVDDAQWIDAASLAALTFAARRLTDERVGVLFASRTGETPEALAGIDICRLEPLSAAEAVDLLSGVGVAPDVAVTLRGRTGGNALALVESARRLSAAERSGAAPVPAGAVPDQPFLDAAASLPEPARDAAALSALAGTAPASVTAAAYSAAGLTTAALRPAEDAGLLTAAADGVTWRHPLAREAVLDVTPAERRRTLAATLAAAAEETGAPAALVVELRVAAAIGPDEELAVDLDRVAVEAAAAGDQERAATLWARAAEIGTDPSLRSRRLLSAADATGRAGHPHLARARYSAALAGGLAADEVALATLALGRIEHTAGSPARAVAAFRSAAAAAGSSALRVRACAEGVAAAMFAAYPAAARVFADEARSAHDPARADERLLVTHACGAAACLNGDQSAGRTELARVVVEAESSGILEEQPDLVLWVVTAPLFGGGDFDAGSAVIRRAIDRLRLAGDLLWLPRVVRLWGVRQLLAGRPVAAFAALDEAVELSRAAQQTTQLADALGVLAVLEAMRGDRAACLAHADELDRLAPTLDVPFLPSSWQARGMLHLGLGEAALAAEALQAAMDVATGVLWRDGALADLVEALVMAGRADDALSVVSSTAHRRAHGLVAEDDEEALEHFTAAAEAAADPFDVARARLLAGERLRRAGRRRQAREELRAAAALFTAAGADPWRRRAEDGLRSSGETLAAAEHEESLTGAELRVATLVAEGRSTKEVAALLFLSPKTVESHLGRIFRKLGLRSRAELAHRMALDAAGGT
jgi:DNA-binding CsgD family transcriptional regulator